MAKIIVWVVRDRRVLEDEVVRTFTDCNEVQNTYSNLESAFRDRYTTEKLWEVTISAKEVKL